MIGSQRSIAMILWIAVGLCLFAAWSVSETVWERNGYYTLAGVCAIMSCAFLLDAMVEHIQRSEDRRQEMVDRAKERGAQQVRE